MFLSFDGSPRPGLAERQVLMAAKKKATRKKTAKKSNGNGANLGFEQTLWQAADKLRNNMDAAEYKHVVLGLIFLKYISDAFQEKYDQLKDSKKDLFADPEDRDEYRAENVFWVPKKARWSILQDNAKQPTIGKLIDDAMTVIEKENPSLKGVLQKDYARPQLDKTRLGELIDLIASAARIRLRRILPQDHPLVAVRLVETEGRLCARAGEPAPLHVPRIRLVPLRRVESLSVLICLLHVDRGIRGTQIPDVDDERLPVSLR